MRHGPKVWTEKVISERAKAGYGTGTGTDYRPWLTVHDLSSRGRQTRMTLRKMGRVVHLHSNIERAFMLVAEYQNSFFDVNEQWPFPRDVTMGAAESLGIRHPTYPVSHAPVVMTLDFLVTTTTPDGELLKTPWDCKREEDLIKPRILEKLSLHRAAAVHLKLQPSRIFTELSVPRQVIRNIEWIRATLPLPGEPEAIHALYTVEPEVMLADVMARCPRLVIREYCRSYDSRRGFDPGTALRVYGWLLWSHKLKIDLAGRDAPQQPVALPTAATSRGSA